MLLTYWRLLSVHVSARLNWDHRLSLEPQDLNSDQTTMDSLYDLTTFNTLGLDQEKLYRQGFGTFIMTLRHFEFMVVIFPTSQHGLESSIFSPGFNWISYTVRFGR